MRSSTAQQRVMQAFLWMKRNLHLDWDFSLCQSKRKRLGNRYGVGAKQAPTAEVAMFVSLEKTLQSAAEHRASRWPVLFGAWCQVLGAVRHQHLQRSILVKVTSQSCFFVCTRGKQKHSRDGFWWSVPSHLVTTGYPIAEQLAKGWQEWLLKDKGHVGLVVNPSSGEHVTMAAAKSCIQSIMGRVLGDDAGRVTSKSWRQLTLVVRSGLSATDQVAFGNWLDSSPGGSTSIPMRYCGSKLEQSTFLRHVVHSMIGHLSQDALTLAELTNAQLEAARTLAVDDATAFLDKPPVLYREFEAPKVASVLMASPFKLKTKFAKKSEPAGGPPVAREVVHPPGAAVSLPVSRPQQVEKPSKVSKPPVAKAAALGSMTPKSAPMQPAMERTLDDDYFNRLAEQRWSRPGHADQPEPPTVVWRGGPEGPFLIIGGILTSAQAEELQAEELETKNVGLVINCLGPKDPRGVRPAAACETRFPVGRQERGKHWPLVRRQVGQALAAQESIFVHCAAGVHRASVATGAILACIQETAPDEALAAIGRVRSVEPEKALRDTGMRRWLYEEADLSPLPGLAVQLPVQFVASRRLAKCNLEVFPILQVKTLGEQRVQVVKKRRIGENLYYSSTGDEHEAEKSVSKYLVGLYTYCLGLAIVGAEKVENAPAEAESLATSTVAYCKVPWDVVYKYRHRAVSFVMKLGEGQPHRLQVLEKLDLAERTAWAAEFSKGAKTLGAVVDEIFTTRDPLWLPESHMRPAEPTQAPRAPGGPSGRVGGNQLAIHLRDGRPLCQAWQHNKCSHQREARCSNGEHLCARPLRSGRVLDVWSKEKGLPSDVLYAGHGHFRHRLPCSHWCNTFKIGQDGSPVVVLLKFIAGIDEYLAGKNLEELIGKRIACDCPVGQPCHVDVLIAKVYESLEARAHPKRRNPWLGPVRMVKTSPVAFTQAAIVAGIRSQFPDVTFYGVSWPPIAHLVNDDVFMEFRAGPAHQPVAADGPLGPEILQRVGVIGGRAALSEQSGSGPQRNALPPVVPFGLTPLDHFHACLALHDQSLPMEAPQVADWDLHFAATCMAEAAHSIQAVRPKAARVIADLGKKLEAVSQYLRSQQHPEVRQVNPAIHLALIAVLVLVMHWPDSSLCAKLFRGFEAIGHVPACGIWGSQEVDYVSIEDILKDACGDGRQLVQSLHSGPDDQVIIDAEKPMKPSIGARLNALLQRSVRGSGSKPHRSRRPFLVWERNQSYLEITPLDQKRKSQDKKER
eukprot:Skav227993  [mRNA]  locus=scaffold390:165629:172005:- [translate_table: standard]